MRLELADHLQSCASLKRFSAMTRSELVAELAELNATLDSLEQSGASCSPMSGFDKLSGMAALINELIA